MHIKQLVINGFRSFRNQSEIEPFSSGHNVIVGRNGSGKSNFFDAIQFVLLAPRFANLRQEDRQHLLHEGAGAGVMAAYVEIIFDNSDGRFPVESDEVILRRSVGFKKDEFFLNRKRVQKTEVSSLLESAGFSKSNPYYIVQQGKVANICMMKDKDRLELLKEVAGTTVYEDRRAESLKIMQETRSKQDQITEVLSFIEERLGELEREKDELKAYEQLDKHRKAIEYTLYDKELARYTEQLSQIEVTREEERQRQQDMYLAFRDVQDQLASEEERLSVLRAGVDKLVAKRGDKMHELSSARSSLGNLEVALGDLRYNKDTTSEKKENLKKEVVELESSITGMEAKLRSVEPDYFRLNEAKAALETEMQSCKGRTEELYAKQGRAKQFTSVKARDQFLASQIEALDVQVADKDKMIAALTKDIAAETERKGREQTQCDKMVDGNQSRAARLDVISRETHTKVRSRNDLQERKKAIWREQEQLTERASEVRAEGDKARKTLNASLPKHIALGLAAVARIVEEKHLTGYYGPLVDNFQLKNDAFRTCVEVAAGNALFHVVVDTDATAALLIKELERRKAGRVTFLPLNRIRNEPVTYPQSNDVRPLMETTLDFEAKFEPAVRMVFGKKLLARDLEVAAAFSKSSGLDAVTKDGDLVNRKGGFEGGYHEERDSRIASLVRLRAATAQVAELEGKESDLKRSAEDVEAALNDLLRELQDLERERDQLSRSTEQAALEITHRRRQIEAAQESVELKSRKLRQLRDDLTAARHQVDVYRAELGTPLHSKLSAAEKEELTTLGERSETLFGELRELEEKVLVIGRQRDGLKADLQTNLLKRLEEARRQLDAVSLKSENAYDNEIGDTVSQIEVSSKSARLYEAELNEIDSSLDKYRHELSTLERDFAQKRQDEEESARTIDAAAKMQDKLLSKRSLLQENIQQKQRQIRDLGTLPRKELEEFRGLSEKPLLGRLKEVQEELKQYAGVNRKALDQYVSFNEQRESLLVRSQQLVRDNASIQQLLSTLDQQKEEAILRTFHDVKGHFADVFKELVPAGEGQLLMGDEVGGEVETQVETPEQMMPGLSGVQIRVSFAGGGQNYDMQQLSGGQKALVALALIFAIQRSDPAPFYLFDEIDQALDANYRASVAGLIRRQAESSESPAQFITTTFRPELVNVADKCYGISLQHKVSSIIPLDKSDAIKFVIDLLNEEEAVGKVSAVPSFSRQQRQKEAAEQLEDYDERMLDAPEKLEEDEDEGEAFEEGDDSEEDEPPKGKKKSRRQ